MLPNSCTYFAYFTGLLWVINLPHGEIASELQIQRHPRICHRKCLQHSSMETECLLSCQLVCMLELLVLCIRWLFVGNYCCLREEVFQMPMFATLGTQWETVLRKRFELYKMSMKHGEHPQFCFLPIWNKSWALRGLWSYFLKIYLIWFDPWVCLTIHIHRTPDRCSQKPEEGIKCPGTGVRASCDPLYGWVLGDWTQVLCNSSWCS